MVFYFFFASRSKWFGFRLKLIERKHSTYFVLFRFGFKKFNWIFSNVLDIIEKKSSSYPFRITMFFEFNIKISGIILWNQKKINNRRKWTNKITCDWARQKMWGNVRNLFSIAIFTFDCVKSAPQIPRLLSDQWQQVRFFHVNIVFCSVFSLCFCVCFSQHWLVFRLPASVRWWLRSCNVNAFVLFDADIKCVQIRFCWNNNNTSRIPNKGKLALKKQKVK